MRDSPHLPAYERSYYRASAAELLAASNEHILGALAQRSTFAVEPQQRNAWLFTIEHFSELLPRLGDAYLFLEFTIPRMGRRVDAVVVYRGVIFVLEYKVGEDTFSSAAVDQVLGYALDLKNFHEASHNLPIIPILIATQAKPASLKYELYPDQVAEPMCATPSQLYEAIRKAAARWGSVGVDPVAWGAGRYKPTPTIVEAAQALYGRHDVREISRSEAGAENLTVTSQYIGEVIDNAKATGTKAICFLTGVPGSGKTLAGLNVANERMNSHTDEHAVFLSGNGPLVEVLRVALAQDALKRPRPESAPKPSKVVEEKKAAAFIQNIHHFRDDNLSTRRPPVEKVVVFDEAQRAWNVEQTSRFMREKRGQAGFNMSEPAFLLSVMDRHEDWCCVVCLVGEGQEINSGEVGISEWFEALQSRFPGWRVHVSDTVAAREPVARALIDAGKATTTSALHLAVSVRSFRAEKVSDLVGAINVGDQARARQIQDGLSQFDIYVTRSLAAARSWLKSKRRGTERAGLLASSNALRLKPEGVFVKAKVDPPLWFLAPRTDVRSSDSLEDAATEFDVQGLELDWACVCWDANFRREGSRWSTNAFKGTRWQSINDPARREYLANTYRVLLTRARQGMVIFVPRGDPEDDTRPPAFYDDTYSFLRECGIRPLNG
jgi:Uncharacterized conserved protein (DUF2075)